MSLQEKPRQKFLVWSPLERKCLSLLNQCKTRSGLLQIHAFMLRNAIESNVNIFTKFIVTSASLALAGPSSESVSAVLHARTMFDNTPHRDDTFLSNAMIKSYLGIRQFTQSFTLYRHLRRATDFVPDNFTFAALAKSCCMGMSIWEGLEIHGQVVKTGFCFDMYALTALVDMYSKFGKLGFAIKLFDEMPEKSPVSWTALICGYVRAGDMVNARMLFDRMGEKDTAAYNAIIDGYAKVPDMHSARSLFDEMPNRNVISWTTMIFGYCNNADVLSAKALFDAMTERNLFSWNAMIAGYCQNKHPHEALKLFHELQVSSPFQPNEVTIVSILPAIAALGSLELGRLVHSFVQSKKLARSANICTALIDMYAKCGEISKAQTIFSEMRKKEKASWNAMINGFAINGCAHEALETFLEMQQEGVTPNDVTLIGVLSACSHGGLVEEGKRWFKAMEDKFGLTPKVEHYGCMVDLLGRAGCLEEAEKLIQRMPCEANGIILSSFLGACGSSKDVTRAERVLSVAVSSEAWNDGNYITMRNLYAAENRWRDATEIKGLMRRNGSKKEVGCSAIEIGNVVSEFVSGEQ